MNEWMYDLVGQYLVECVAVVPEGYSAVWRHVVDVDVLIHVNNELT